MNERAPAERAPIGETVRVLKMWRELAGLNQRELADLAGIHYTTISDYETGKSVPQEQTIARVTAALGMTAAEREVAESYIRRTWPGLRPIRLDQAGPRNLEPPSSAEFAAWGQEIAQATEDAGRSVARLLRLLFDLLIRTAEAVTVKPGPGTPEA